MICERCHKEYDYICHKGMTKQYCIGCVTTIARRRNKAKMIAYKGGKCERCGYNRCNDVLCFHHKDPSIKELTLVGGVKSWDRTKAEIDKCMLLCSNCHMEEHEKLENNDIVIQKLAEKAIQD